MKIIFVSHVLKREIKLIYKPFVVVSNSGTSCDINSIQTTLKYPEFQSTKYVVKKLYFTKPIINDKTVP